MKHSSKNKLEKGYITTFVLMLVLIAWTIFSFVSCTPINYVGGNYIEPVIYLDPETATHEDSLKVAQTDYLTWGYNKRNKVNYLGRY